MLFFSILMQMEVLKASLSNREYEIITECASSNFSETPNIVPSLYDELPTTTSTDAITSSSPVHSEASINGRVNQEDEVVPLTAIKCSVTVNLIGLSLHSGLSRDSPLATVEVCALVLFWYLSYLYTHQMSRNTRHSILGIIP